ncbi:MAG: hypothetical protein HQK77_02180 [Desulfobacterales bacterium]|nr:hypothetical protein [Desulfobacterales bacterium]
MNVKLILDKHRKIIVFIFFTGYLLLGLSIFKDYGISFDEGFHRNDGVLAASYINKKIGSLISTNNLIQNPDELQIENKHHGVIFHLIAAELEYIFNLKDFRDIFLMKHVLTFLTFWVSVIFFYFVIVNRFEDWKIGLLGCFFLILSPRIFAESFYNAKDIIFLSCAIVNIFTLIKFLQYQDKPFIFIVCHAFSSALLIDIRIVGVYSPFLTLLFISIELFKSESPKNYIKKMIPVLCTYLSLLTVFLYIFWPYLWENPIHNFIQSFRTMSKFDWDSYVLYQGSFIKASKLGRNYIPTWILITTPALYTSFFFTGIFYILSDVVKPPFHIYTNKAQKINLVFLSLCLFPLLAVIFLKSTVYDGWRHLYFIYPSFLLIALTGFVKLIEYAKLNLKGLRYHIFNSILSISIIYSLISTALFMITYHPYQNVYFNFIAGKDISKKFELDYWGLSYKQALEYILTTDQKNKINIAVMNFPGVLNVNFLDQKLRERVNLVPIEQATYFLTNYRFRKFPQEYYKFDKKVYPFINEVFAIQIKDYKIMGVYKVGA